MDDPRDRQLAHFYDLEYSSYTEDFDFYVQYASFLDSERKLPVLELGCGTGRILLALAQAGFRMVGVDSSKAMLDVCAHKAEAQGLNAMVSLTHSDMGSLADVPHSPFNLAFCALNTFAYLTTTDDQLAMLAAVRPLLIQHGVLLIDLTPPLDHLLPSDSGEMIYQGSYPDPDTGGTLHKFIAGYAEPSKQTHNVRMFYDLELPDGTVRRTTKEDTFRWTGRYEMELLLDKAGYRLEKVYGGYDLEEYGDESDRMIFAARS